ncbi:hypothetical protein ABTX77_28715 [Streptomyces sp. NPDC097704]|uniref:hypothetical protein n=1 Tax=Streptomyces sp. NPDC097704 TaxID=3157101 RepID=UPI0033213CF6
MTETQVGGAERLLREVLGAARRDPSGARARRRRRRPRRHPHPCTTQSLRRTVVERRDTVPLDDALRTELTAPHGKVPRTWLTPLLVSGDPRLVVPALRWGVRQAAQQYALLRIWERTGPNAVRTLLDDRAVRGPGTASAACSTARLLAYPGGAARRTDAPPEARTVLEDLFRSRLGTNPAAWHRVAQRLSGLDPEWSPVSTVEALLAD